MYSLPTRSSFRSTTPNSRSGVWSGGLSGNRSLMTLSRSSRNIQSRTSQVCSRAPGVSATMLTCSSMGCPGRSRGDGEAGVYCRGCKDGRGAQGKERSDEERGGAGSPGRLTNAQQPVIRLQLKGVDGYLTARWLLKIGQCINGSGAPSLCGGWERGCRPRAQRNSLAWLDCHVKTASRSLYSSVHCNTIDPLQTSSAELIEKQQSLSG